MTQTTISMASNELILVEQYSDDACEVQTLVLTSEDLLDLCLLAWPEAMKEWMTMYGPEVSLPLPFEKNPPRTGEGPEGIGSVVALRTEAQEAEVAPVDRRAAA